MRVTNMRHNKKDEEWTGENPENYKVKTDIEFYVDVEQKVRGVWQPFDASDLQMQFVMLDPYYQVALQKESPASATYSYKFKVPDKLGIFRFVLDYNRYGLSSVYEEMEVSIIQFRHDEFPRFMLRATPYYLSVGLSMLAFFLFIVSYLFTDFSKVPGVK